MYVLSLWKLCNHKYHGPDNKTPPYKQKLLENQARKYYNNKHELIWIDRTLFDVPLKVRLKESFVKLQQFLNYIKPICQLSKKQAKLRDKQVKKPINEYFQATTTKNSTSSTTC